jgi:putative heme iron utilization protein
MADSPTPSAPPRPDLGADVRKLLHEERSGVLSTISVRYPGFPFGSVAPYALTPALEPLFLMSALAEHTKNALADARASLLVHNAEAREDVQAGARVTVLGRLERVAEAEVPSVQARYLARAPGASVSLGDFAFYVLRPEAVRFIGGFGRIAWVDVARVQKPPQVDVIAAAAAGICEHMNQDHPDTLAVLCEAKHQRKGERYEMTSVDPLGFEVRVDGQPAPLYFEFGAEALDPDGVRTQLILLAKKARAALAQTGGAA